MAGKHGALDRATAELRALLARADRDDSARAKALRLLTQRTVLAATWPDAPEAVRTLQDEDGTQAIALFTGVDTLGDAAQRFGWRTPGRTLSLRELDTRDALQSAIDQDVRFVVIDVCSDHVLELERDEIASAVGVRSSTMNRPPVAQASTPPPPSSKPPPPRRTSKWPTAAFHPSAAPSPLAEIDLPFQERPTTTRRLGSATKESPRPRAKRADAGSEPGSPRPSSRPAAAATLFEISSPTPRPSAAPTTRAVAPFAAPPVPAARPAPPPPLPTPAPPPPVASPPPRPVAGVVGFDYDAIDAAPPPPAARSAPPPRRESFKPPPEPTAEPRASVRAPAPSQRPPAATVSDADERDPGDTRPERRSARAPDPKPPAPRSVAPPADTALRRPTTPLAEELLRKLADALRKYPEVEWASEASDGTSVPVIGVRVDPAFLTRADEIEWTICELAQEQGAAVRVLVLTDASRMREARNQGNVFFPWRKRGSKSRG
jgi:hypothetical protein